MAETLPIDENKPGLDGIERRKYRSPDPNALDDGRKQASKLRPVVAGEPAYMPDELVAVGAIESPALRPFGARANEVPVLNAIEPEPDLVHDIVRQTEELLDLDAVRLADELL